jgi:hypothetical protein
VIINRLAGHELPHEGKATKKERRNFAPQQTGLAVGHTYCSCGARSPELPSDNARKRWHREHKDEIRRAEKDASDETR